MEGRKRKIDVSKLSNERIDELSDQIGEKVRKLVDETIKKVNKMLAVYDMQAKMQIVLQEKTRD